MAPERRLAQALIRMKLTSFGKSKCSELPQPWHICGSQPGARQLPFWALVQTGL